MNLPSSVLLVASLALLSGCASMNQGRMTQEAVRLGVPSPLTEKLDRGGRLTLADIETLVRQSVPEESILTYLRRTGVRYELTTAQIDQLRASGVSDRLIDYLLSTPTIRTDRNRGYQRMWARGHWSHGWHSHGHAGHGGHH